MGPLHRRMFLGAVDSPFILNLLVNMRSSGGALAVKNGPSQVCLGSLLHAEGYPQHKASQPAVCQMTAQHPTAHSHLT